MPKTFKTSATLTAKNDGKLIFEIDQDLFIRLHAIASKFPENTYKSFWRNEKRNEELKDDAELADLFEDEKYYIRVKDNSNIKYKKGVKYDLNLNLSLLSGEYKEEPSKSLILSII